MRSRDGRKRTFAAVAPAALLSLAYLSRHHWGGGEDDLSCKVSLGKYNGPRYQKKGETLHVACLVESKWMLLSQHVVSLGGKSKGIIHDWLFVDYHDRINVLVEAWDDDDQTNDKRYVVFKQTKYAYSGDSMAIVGGIIEPNEEPEVAARREVQEEMNVNCERLISLGKYRTDVNRGMGWVHSFIASDCREMTDRESANDSEEIHVNQVGAADTEGQERILLTVAELRDAARNGEFVEVQWSNTVALALFRIDL